MRPILTVSVEDRCSNVEGDGGNEWWLVGGGGVIVLVVEGIVLGKLVERAEEACWCCGAGLLGAGADVHNGTN